MDIQAPIMITIEMPDSLHKQIQQCLESRQLWAQDDLVNKAIALFLAQEEALPDV